MHTVADRNLVSLNLVGKILFDDSRAEAGGRGQHLERGNRVAEPAPSLLEIGIELLGQISAEADARDVEEGMAVHGADIDIAQLAAQDDLCRLVQLERNFQRACEVVCGSK